MEAERSNPAPLLQLVSLPEAKLLLKEDDELIQEVFDYWSRKRKVGKPGCLLAVVKQEKRDGSSTSDPYVAFRRRTEKMQTRKVSVHGGQPVGRGPLVGRRGIAGGPWEAMKENKRGKKTWRII